MADLADLADHSKAGTTVVTKEVEVTDPQSVSSDHEVEHRKRVFRIKSKSSPFTSPALRRSLAETISFTAPDLFK